MNYTEFWKAESETVPLKFYNSKYDTFTVICNVKLVSFSTNYFLSVFSDYLEHLWNRLKYRNTMSVLNSHKALKVVDAKQWWFHAANDGIYV